MKYGLKIDFKNKPQLVNVPKIPHNTEEKRLINFEINKLLKKGVITKCQNEQDNFISTVFTRKKKDGTFRTILNIKYLNEFVEYRHLKMESLEDVFKILKMPFLPFLCTFFIKNILNLNGSINSTSS